MKNKTKRPPVQQAMCATCPFRPGSKYAELAEYLTSASTREARECHSTGSNAINHRTGKPVKLCRGSRDIQSKMFAATGFIEAATDEAWEKKCAEMGL